MFYPEIKRVAFNFKLFTFIDMTYCLFLYSFLMSNTHYILNKSFEENDFGLLKIIFIMLFCTIGMLYSFSG